MIHEIQPHRFDLAFRRRPAGEGDYVVALKGEQLLLARQKERDDIPAYETIRSLCSEIDDRLLYLFTLDDRGFYFLPEAPKEAEGFYFRDIQILRNFQPSWLAFAGATACHLAAWYVNNRHCGKCGSVSTERGGERALECRACGNIVYPRISPAVIVGVMDGDRLLLTKYANRPYARWALIAGFLEIGETLEDAVRREVREEVGLEIRNLRYYKSQPWPFSGSLLAGFFADLDGAPEIVLDANELQEARWIYRPEIPKPESSISLTAEMIEVFRCGMAPWPNKS
ncbi:MAG: NAD(+) diphosphatase [Planctomycetes bacterium]|nr:NAD(+) diphosphatase [Planctomycetota bacterium]